MTILRGLLNDFWKVIKWVAFGWLKGHLEEAGTHIYHKSQLNVGK